MIFKMEMTDANSFTLMLLFIAHLMKHFNISDTTNSVHWDDEWQFAYAFDPVIQRYVGIKVLNNRKQH